MEQSFCLKLAIMMLMVSSIQANYILWRSDSGYRQTQQPRMIHIKNRPININLIKNTQNDQQASQMYCGIQGCNRHPGVSYGGNNRGATYGCQPTNHRRPNMYGYRKNGCNQHVSRIEQLLKSNGNRVIGTLNRNGGISYLVPNQNQANTQPITYQRGSHSRSYENIVKNAINNNNNQQTINTPITEMVTVRKVQGPIEKTLTVPDDFVEQHRSRVNQVLNSQLQQQQNHQVQQPTETQSSEYDRGCLCQDKRYRVESLEGMRRRFDTLQAKMLAHQKREIMRRLNQHYHFTSSGNTTPSRAYHSASICPQRPHSSCNCINRLSRSGRRYTI